MGTLPRLVLLLSVGISPQASAEEPPSIVFSRVQVFDGEKMLAPRDVLVSSGVIQVVSEEVLEPGDALVIDGAGHTLLPGLLDAHVHAFDVQHLRQALVFGVTTVLDMFTDPAMVSGLRKEEARGGGNDRADLRSSGTLVTAPGGHGTEYGLPIPTLAEGDDVQAFVDARLAEGSDYIKVVYDDASTIGYRIPTLSLETLRAVIDAAHARDKLAVVHIWSARAAEEAIAAGADGLVHVFADAAPADDFGARAKESGAFITPTLTVVESACGIAGGAQLASDERLAAFLRPDDVRRLQRGFPGAPGRRAIYAIAPAVVARLRTAQVPLLAGTDAPNPGTVHGCSLHRELQLLVEAGLSPVEALAAATSVPAAAFGLEDRGRIAPGQRADLLLVRGDPGSEITDTRNIVGVWKRGVALDRDAYRERVAAKHAKWAAYLSVAPPEGSAAGSISDFDDGTPAAAFGSGWMVSTDAMVGGRSQARMEVVEGGAGGSGSSLRIHGAIESGAAATWAGAMFTPSPVPGSPANLSAHGRIRFSARGDGQAYVVRIFAASRGWQGASRGFRAGPDWQEISFELESFDGLDGRDLTGIFIGMAGDPAAFELQIDDVRME